MIKQISKFEQVRIIPGGLIVLDIDDTVLRFPNNSEGFWNTVYNNHLKTNDHDTSQQLTIGEWEVMVNQSKPEFTDEYISTFIKNALAAKCEIIFLTARDERMREITNLQLGHLGFKFPRDSVHFNRNKGLKLRQIADRLNYKHITMVDDLNYNLKDIIESFGDSNYILDLYEFRHGK